MDLVGSLPGRDNFPENATQKRKRPIRTYGKKTTYQQDDNTPTKKRKVRDENNATLTKHGLGAKSPLPVLTKEGNKQLENANNSEKSESCPTSNTQLPPSQKRNILSYFSPIPTSSTCAPQSDILSGECEPPSTPPSSPPPTPCQRPRKLPRRLTMRLVTSDATSCTVVCPDNSQPKSREESDDKSKGSESNSVGGDKPKGAKPSGLRSVQMTLNLSMNGTLTECKLCDMFYNAVHPHDVKLHAKRHTEVLKRL